ncbi:MAG: hypothetical protein Kow00109_07160 [Acidobacteriota bacterium]
MDEFTFHRHRLENGLVLLHHENSTVPLVSLNVFLLGGKDQNPPDRPGLSTFVARMLDEGTRRRDHLALSAELEGMGAEMHTFSEREVSGICMTVLSQHLPRGMAVVAEILREPAFPADRVEKQRALILEHLRATAEDPELRGSQALNRVLYSGTPLAEPTLGTPEAIRSVTAAELAEFHRRCYGPAGTYVVVVGDVDFSRAIELTEEHFGAWTNPDQVRQTVGPIPESSRGAWLWDPLEREQVHVFVGCLGLDRRSPDYYAARVLDAVLGGGNGFVSRIPRLLRDELGLAYVTYTDLSSSAGIFPGRFIGYVATGPEHWREAHDVLISEIERFCEEGPTPEEVELAYKFLTGSFPFEFSSNLSIARLLLAMEVFDLGDDFPARFPSLIAEVTPEQVRKVAARYLNPINYTTVVVGTTAEL